MQNNNDLPAVSMSNTKKELFDAYEAMKQVLKAQESELLSSEKLREAAEKKSRVRNRSQAGRTRSMQANS